VYDNVTMKIGYARVSTEEQNLDLQIEALKSAGCEKIFSDRGFSAIAKKRPEFETAKASLNKGDIFIIWKFDRAFRSLVHALNFLEELEGQGIQFKSLTENIDTTTPHGRLVFQITNAMAEFERSLISERTKAGLKASAAQGQKLGRRRKIDKMWFDFAKEKREQGESMASIARTLKVSRSTLYRYFEKE